MRYSRSFAITGVLALAADASAFVTPISSKATSCNGVQLFCYRPSSCIDKNEIQNKLPRSIRDIAAISSVALGLLIPTSNAFAAPDARIFSLHQTEKTNAVYSSTVTLSDVIRTMDFSLPSSYNDISDPVASGADELTQPAVKSAASSTTKKKVEKAKKPSGGRGMSISMPSFGGPAEGGGGGSSASSGGGFTASMTAEERAAAMAKRRAEREDAAAREKAEAEARAKQATEERNARITADRLERVAKRQEEQAMKEAADTAKREETFKGAKIIDTSLPSY